MNIYVRELKAHRKSLIIWSVSIVFLILGGMTKYSAGRGAGAGSFNEIMKQMPESLQNLFGVGVFDLSYALDFYGVLYIYIALVVSIHAVMLGVGIISKEERDKTSEFLLVKPISRTNIVTSKLLSALTMILIINFITYITSFAMLMNYSDKTPFEIELFKLVLGLLILQILFTVLGTCIAALISKPKLSAAIATGTLLVMFLLSIITDLTENLKILRFLTPFQYYNAKEIMKGEFDITYLFITIILLALLSFGTYFFYNRRDIRV